MPSLPSRPRRTRPAAEACGDRPRRFPGIPLAAILLLVAALGRPEGARAQADTTRADLKEKTVTAEYELYAGNKTLKEARREAIDRARAEAVRKAIGTQVQAQRRSSTIETGEEVVSRFSQVVRTGASGRVVDSKVLKDTLRQRGGSTFQYVRIRATVEPSTGQPDQGFTVDLRLTDDDQTFVARTPLEKSDEVIAEIEVSKDAYLTLFSVTADTLQVIWPNSLSKDTFVPAGTTVQFPPPDLRARGLHLRVEVPKGRNQITERLVAVATKQKVPFQEVPTRQIEGGVLETTQATLQALNRWLVEIPLGQRAVQSVTYDVVRADAR